MLFNMMTVSIDCIKVLQAGCAEVDLLKSESKEAFKELTEVQAELLESKTRQIEMMQTEVKNTLKTEIKSYSDAVKKASGEIITIKKIKSVVEDVVEDRSKSLLILASLKHTVLVAQQKALWLERQLLRPSTQIKACSKVGLMI